MKKCIICDTDKEEKEFNKEHIIPEALGNKKLFFYDVCRNCNSNLGSNVDKYLVDNFIMQLIRNKLKISSQNNIIPNPFKSGTDKEGNIIYTDNGLVPYIRRNLKENDGKIIVTAKNSYEAIKIITKKLSRLKFTESEIKSFLEQATTKTNFSQPTVKYDIVLDFGKIEISILKIAYEYAFHKLGDKFMNDEVAIEIKNVNI